MTLRVAETHISTLFFVDDLVLKRKKPLDLGFADFRRLDARLRACQDEVRLNSRLSPDVYHGVSTLLDVRGEPCEHFVVMSAMPDSGRLSRLVRERLDVSSALVGIAGQLAALHRRTPPPPDLLGVARAEGLRALWSEGLTALRSMPGALPQDVVDSTDRLARQWLAGRADLLDERVRSGRVHDGHGDLLADDIFLLEDGPRILDCLEFDQRLRVCDGLADAAFLAMDLERLGAPVAARAFLDAYSTAADDSAPPALEDHYLAYRAHVRCKVAALRAAQDPAPDHTRQAGLLGRLALDHLQRGQVRLVLVGGLPGSGKTSVSTGLAQGHRLRHLSSDVVRKRLVKGGTDGSGFETGAYAHDVTDRTYAELLRLAGIDLRHGVSVVLDASFNSARHREAARRLGHACAAAVVELQCTVADDVAEQRLRCRPPGPSDATPLVRRQMSARAEHWPEASVVDTGADLGTCVAAVGSRVWPAAGELVLVEPRPLPPPRGTAAG